MPLQLRDLATGEMIEVPNEGHTIGREGGPADVKLKDKGLSGKHARIFADGTEWLIQDLGSTNGTYLGELKLSATTEIHPNDVITMGATKLEVVKVWDPTLQQTLMMPSPVFETLPAVKAVSRTPVAAAAKSKSAASLPVVAEKEEPPSESQNPTMIGQPGMVFRTPSAQADEPAPAATSKSVAAPEEAPETAPTMIGVGAMADASAAEEYEAAKKAFAKGTPAKPAAAKAAPAKAASAKHAKHEPEAEEPEAPAQAEEHSAEAPAQDEAQSEAYGPQDASAEQKGVKYFLIAVPKAIAFYLAAIPLMLVNPIGTVKKGIAEQKHEPMGKMELIAYAIPPLFVSAFLPAIATGIALAVAGTFSIMSFIPIVPAISAVIGAAITGWFFHPVMGWIITKLKGTSDERSRTNYFLMLMTATAVLAVPNAIAILLGMVHVPFIGLVGVILSLVASLASLFVLYSWLVYFDVMKIVRTIVLVLGALSVVGAVFGGLMAQVAIIRGMGSSGSGGAAASDAKEAADKAIADAKEAIAKGQEAAADAKEAAGDQVKEAEAEVKEAVNDAKPAAKEKVAVAAPPAVDETPVTYAAYVQMRDAVEKNIADDPAVLNRSPELLALYKSYTKATFDVDSKFNALNEKNPADAKLNVRLKEAELHEKTGKMVKALFSQLKPAPVKGEAKAEAKPPEAKPAAAAKEEKPKAEAKPAEAKPAAKEEKPKAEAKPAEAKPAPKAEAKPAEAKPAPAAKAEAKPAEAKPAEAKPAPAAKAEAKPAEAKPAAAAGKGKLACSSKPAQADIWVDGKNSGKKTPLAVSSALELPSGKHTVIFKLNGKASAPQEISVEANQTVVLKGIEIPGA